MSTDTEHTSLPAAYMLAKLQMVMPLLQEARDALTALSETQRRLHGISMSLADRMDAAGTFSLDDWQARAAIAQQAEPAKSCEWTHCPTRVGNVCCREMQAEPAAKADAQPVASVLYVSPQQVPALLADPENESGMYIPCRKTPGGLFTMPLYAAAPTARQPLTEAQIEDKRPMMCEPAAFAAGVRFAERAHGITQEKP